MPDVAGSEVRNNRLTPGPRSATTDNRKGQGTKNRKIYGNFTNDLTDFEDYPTFAIHFSHTVQRRCVTRDPELKSSRRAGNAESNQFGIHGTERRNEPGSGNRERRCNQRRQNSSERTR